MSKKYQNFADFCQNSGKKQVEIFQELRKKMKEKGFNLSFTTYNSWKGYRYIPTDEEKLKIISDYTEIPIQNLFNE